MILHGCVWSTI